MFCAWFTSHCGQRRTPKCWCGDESIDIDDFYVFNDASCNRPCRGDPEQYCGGWFASSVYQYTDASVIGEKRGISYLVFHRRRARSVQSCDDISSWSAEDWGYHPRRTNQPSKGFASAASLLAFEARTLKDNPLSEHLLHLNIME